MPVSRPARDDSLSATRFPGISVIIPTYRSSSGIVECLEALHRQTGPPIEVIVVDKHSDDGTEKTARVLGAVVVLSHAGMSEARNVGISHSRGQYIMCLDADMTVESGIMEDCVAKISNGYDALVIPEVTIGIGFWATCRQYERDLYLDDPDVESPRFFRRTVLEQIGGFDPTLLFGEDMDMAVRLREGGYRVGRSAKRIIHQEGRVTLESRLRKRFTYALTAPRFARKHGRQTWRFFGPRKFVKRATLQFLIDRPLVFGGFLVLKTFEYVVSAAGYCYGRLANV